MYDKDTVRFYDLNVSDYVSWSKINCSFKLEKKFRRLVNEPHSIIDIGCGAGHSSIWFSQNGCSVTALDPSSKMIERLRSFSHLRLLTGSILAFEVSDIFDGAWASFSLQHLKAQDQKKACKIIYESLKPKGIFYLGIHKGKNSYRDNLGRLYVPRDENQLTAELEKIGFEIQDISTKKSLSFEKASIEIMHIFCKKL